MEKEKKLVMPEFISTPSPAEDKYSCHQDSATESSSEDKSTELVSK